MQPVSMCACVHTYGTRTRAPTPGTHPHNPSCRPQTLTTQACTETHAHTTSFLAASDPPIPGCLHTGNARRSLQHRPVAGLVAARCDILQHRPQLFSVVAGDRLHACMDTQGRRWAEGLQDGRKGWIMELVQSNGRPSAMLGHCSNQTGPTTRAAATRCCMVTSAGEQAGGSARCAQPQSKSSGELAAAASAAAICSSCASTRHTAWDISSSQ